MALLRHAKTLFLHHQKQGNSKNLVRKDLIRSVSSKESSGAWLPTICLFNQTLQIFLVLQCARIILGTGNTVMNELVLTIMALTAWLGDRSFKISHRN